MGARRLRREEVRPEVPEHLLPFEDTGELAPQPHPPGVERAAAALDLALALPGGGHAVVLGAPGSGRRALALARARAWAQARPAPPDRIYLADPEDPWQLRAFTLAPGRAPALAADLAALAARLDELGADAAAEAARIGLAHGGDEPLARHLAALARAARTAEEPARLLRPAVLASGTAAPVVLEPDPAPGALLGELRCTLLGGSLVAGPALVRPGALHRANGGCLVVDAGRVRAAGAWEALLAALDDGAVRPLPPQTPGAPPVAAEPVPLALRVILVAERDLYHELAASDPVFARLFGIVADIRERLPLAEAALPAARHLAHIARSRGMPPLHRGAVARILEEGLRAAEDAGRVWLEAAALAQLAAEAGHAAIGRGAPRVEAGDVEAALAARRARTARYAEEVRDDIASGVVRIETEGRRVGQVNGLTVVELGPFGFAQPVRITATARVGEGEVIDIEREADLGGPGHTKGVLILAHFLAQRYATERPLSLHASIASEQSHAWIDGDSASLAELCALLSALADLPLRQDLAVTGAVDQLGWVQAVGGVNDKVEAFFEVCALRGLSGGQGVVLPAANAAHLVLRREVAEAVAAGRFHVHAVETVDDAMELLTGVRAGRRRRNGRFPEGSINRRVEDRLLELARRRQAAGEAAERGGRDGR